MRRSPEMLPPVEVLWKVLRYEPSTGLLYWRARTPDMFNARTPALRRQLCTNWNAVHADRPALNAESGNGYRAGTLFGLKVGAHQVCWAMIHGRWPTGDVDHQDGDGLNNRPRNIRAVDHGENMKNARRPRHNRSGVIGVSWDRNRQKWQAGIQHRGKTIGLGRFDTFDAACSARARAEKRFGFHPNHGRAAPCAS